MKKQNMLFLLAALLTSCGGVDSSSYTEEITPTESISESDSNTGESSKPDIGISESTDYYESSTPNITESEDTSVEVTTPFHKEKNITHYLGSDNDVYRINITTKDNQFPEDKENYVSGSLNVTEQDQNKVIQTDMNMKIKLRGNSTFSADKKPFKIKFDDKQSMFGLEKSKEWVLLANYLLKTK